MAFYQSFLDQLIGQNGIVTESIPPEQSGTGVIKVAGQLWSADTAWPELLLPDTIVIVVGRAGLRLEVLPERG